MRDDVRALEHIEGNSFLQRTVVDAQIRIKERDRRGHFITRSDTARSRDERHSEILAIRADATMRAVYSAFERGRRLLSAAVGR